MNQMVKKDSKFQNRKQRGLVHQGSYQPAQMTYTCDTDDLIIETQSDQIMEEDEVTEEQKKQVSRIKELRQQKRNNEFIPIDEAAKELMDSFEAHMLQKQLIKDKYTTELPSKKDVPKSIIVDMEMCGSDQEDEEEVEALIKKRVKEGAGRDYDTIVRRDVINYQKVTGSLEAREGFSETSKYESSIEYKNIQVLMEIDDENLFGDIDNEIKELSDSIHKNQDRLLEMRKQELMSESEIRDADTRFQESGEQFIKAKQAMDLIDDLKDMLTEKSLYMIDLTSRRFALEKKIKFQIDACLISHVCDIYRECGEQQLPYGFSHNYSDVLDRIVKDSSMQLERKHFRLLHEQSDLWQSALDMVIQSEGKAVKELQVEARHNIFGDVDELYKSPTDSLFAALTLISDKLPISDIAEFVVPYFQEETLKASIFNFDHSQTFIDVSRFVDGYYTAEHERQVFTSTVLTGSLQQYAISYITNLWNPFNELDTKNLQTFLSRYLELIYIEKDEFGVTYVTAVLNAVLSRLQSMLAIFHITTNTSLLLSNAVEAISKIILSFRDVLPSSNIEHLLVELLTNFVKSLNKKLVKEPIDRQRAQPLYDLIFTEATLQYLKSCKTAERLLLALSEQHLNNK